MWSQYLVHVYLVLLRWQLVKHHDILRANRVFWRRAQPNQIGSKASPCRLLLIVLLLLFELFVEYLDEVDEAFLAQSDFGFLFCAFVHFHLDFLRQLILVLQQNTKRFDQRLLMLNALD